MNGYVIVEYFLVILSKAEESLRWGQQDLNVESKIT